MPFGVKAECLLCGAKEAVIWQKSGNGVICNGCHEKCKEEEKQQIVQKQKDEETQLKAEQADVPKPSKIVLRKSTRMTRNYKTRGNPYALPKPTLARGRGRRGLLRRAPVRLPSEGRLWMKTNKIYVNNGQLRIGDIVNMVGADNEIYYAQLRGFMVDVFGEKRAVITWLIPTHDFVRGKFNPNNFYLGPDEDIPRKISTMEFECRLTNKEFNFCLNQFPRENPDTLLIEPLPLV